MAVFFLVLGEILTKPIGGSATMGGDGDAEGWQKGWRKHHARKHGGSICAETQRKTTHARMQLPLGVKVARKVGGRFGGSTWGDHHKHGRRRP